MKDNRSEHCLQTETNNTQLDRENEAYEFKLKRMAELAYLNNKI